METLLFSLMMLVAVVILGILYEQNKRYSAKKSFTDNGTYVEVNGEKLHYHLEGNGKATVVFESGIDFRGHLIWKKIQPEIAKFATTLSYDRSGILRSSRGDKDKTAKNIAEDLHALLEKVNISKPYILVGHSLAGLPFRYFVDKYPDDISGVVFVDASSPEQIKRLPEKLQKKMLPKSPLPWITKLLLNVGVIRILMNSFLKKTDKEGIFLNNRVEINAYLINSILATNDEVASIESMLDEVKDIKSFGEIPLSIMAATKSDMKKHDEMVKIFNTIAKENLSMSSNSKIIWADCGHYIPLEKPQLVIDTIKEML